MKTKFKIIGTLILIFIIFLIYIIAIRKEFNNKMNIVKSREGDMVNYDYPVKYFYQVFECPNSIQDMIDLIGYDTAYANYVKTQFNDVFANNENALISYIPVYNRKNLKREAFVILSAGIDGKLDNIFDVERDTLFIDNLKNRFKLYNPISISDTFTPFTFKNNIIGFNLYDYFFGKKDYIINYVNCIDHYKMQGGPYSLDDIIERNSNKKDIGKILVVEFDDSLLIESQKDSVKTFIYKGLKINCKPYYEDDFLFKKFVGINDGINIENKEVNLINCISVD